MIPQGFAVAVSDRTPMIAVFDMTMIVVLIWATLSAVFGNFRFDLSERRLLLLSIIFVFANMLSFFVNSEDMLRSILAIKVFVFGLLSYVLIRSTLRSKRSLEIAIDGLVVWGVVVSGMLVYQLLFKWQYALEKDDIGIGMGRSNYLAAMMLPIIPIAIGRIFQKKGIWRLVFGMLSAAIVLGLVVTMSRGALLSLAITFVLTLPFSGKIGLRIWHIGVGLLLLVLVVSALPKELLTTATEMISYRFANPDYNRIELWTAAWHAFLDNPILGVGPNIIYMYNRQFAIEDLYTHNYVLNVLADLGLVGAVPFFLLLWSLVARSFRVCVRSLGNSTLRIFGVASFIGLVATLIHGMVEPTFQGQQYLVVFFAMMAFIHAFEQLNSPSLAPVSDVADPRPTKSGHQARSTGRQLAEPGF